MTADYFTNFGLQKIAVNEKTLFWRIKNYHTQETSSLTREVRDDKGGKTTNKTTREGGRDMAELTGEVNKF